MRSRGSVWERRGPRATARGLPSRLTPLPRPVRVVGLLLAAVACGPAQARDGFASSPAELLARMDGDRDGRVALAEYQDYLIRGFRALDLDGDGVVTVAELGARSGGRGRAVDLTSRERALAESFARQDADASGFLDAAELAAPPR